MHVGFDSRMGIIILCGLLYCFFIESIFPKINLGVVSATIQSQHTQRTHVTKTITWTLTKTITWLWRWLLHRLSKSITITNNSPSQDSNHPDDLFQSRYVTPGSNHFLKHVHYKSWLSSKCYLVLIFTLHLRQEYWPSLLQEPPEKSCCSILLCQLIYALPEFVLLAQCISKITQAMWLAQITQAMWLANNWKSRNLQYSYRYLFCLFLFLQLVQTNKARIVMCSHESKV